MPKKMFDIQFHGFEELAEVYKMFGDKTKDIAEKCLRVAPKVINPKLHRDMARHHRTGDTENSIVEYYGDAPCVEWRGFEGSLGVGFSIREGGLASIFLMYGTARHAPRNQYGGIKYDKAKQNGGMNADKRLFDDIFSAQTEREIHSEQEDVFYNEFNKLYYGGKI